MPNEALISRIETLLDEIVSLGGASERTGIVSGLIVVDSAPSSAALANHIIVRDSRDGNFISVLKTPGQTYANNDLVSVLFIEGTEPIALAQSPGSSSGNVKVSEVWESDFGAVAGEADASGNWTWHQDVILDGASKAIKGTGSNTPDLGTTTDSEKMGNIYQASGKDIYPEDDGGGLFQRNVDHWRSPDDHFNAFSGWTWDSTTFNGAPAVVDVATYPSLLRLRNDSIAEDHFAYQSISVASGASGYSAYARLSKGLDSYVGIRLDNGDNDDFVECRIEDSVTYPGQFRLAIRWRVGGGSITTTYGTDPLNPAFWLIQILKVSNSFFLYVIKDSPIPMYAGLTTGANVFALSRAGVIFGQRGAVSANDRVGLFDWIEHLV